MFDPVTLPLWVVMLFGVATAWLILERLLVPSVWFFLRRRVNRVLDDVNTRFRVKIQPFKLTKRQVLIDRLMYDPLVMKAAERFGEAERMPRDLVMAKVERYAREIIPSFNAYVYFRLGYWLARSLSRALYRVRLGGVDQESLARIPADSTFVFVMNHRSNMDYVLVAYLAAERVALSYAVGEWARIFPLESLIRSMGAYFVRRKSGNELYRKVLARYVAMATKAGVPQAVYLEGGLSRDGSLQVPKLGLLDYMLRDFDPQGQRDLVFIPVGLNYDRVLEDRTLILDSDPGAERRTGLAAAATTIGFLARNLGLWAAGRWFRFGYACVDLGAPVSVRKYLTSREVDPRKLERAKRFAVVGDLAELLMKRVGDVVPVVPVALVANVLARQPGRKWTRLEIKAAVEHRIGELQRLGARVHVPRNDDDYTIDVGLRMLILRRLVIEEDGRLSVDPDEERLLDYYAQSIAHLQEPRAGLSVTGLSPQPDSAGPARRL